MLRDLCYLVNINYLGGDHLETGVKGMAAVTKRPKSVSWAPGVKLCQVRLFLSEDAPSLSGQLGVQDNLQAKASWLWHSTEAGSDESLPPGFEGHHPIEQFEKEVPQIPLVKWQCPSSLNPLYEWLVVAGEESEEVEVENRRQRGVLEAIYPRSSSIPPNPSISPEASDPHHNDDYTPIVPITAIEEEDSDPSCPAFEDHIPGHLKVPTTITNHLAPPLLKNLKHATEQAQHGPSSQTTGKSPLGIIPGVEPDIAAAATAAFTAMVKSNDEGSLIDRDLLIQILSDPKMIEKLMSEYGPRNQRPPPPLPPSLPSFPSPSIPVAGLPPPPPMPLSLPTTMEEGRRHTRTVMASTLSFPPQTTEPVKETVGMREAGYFHNLIQQHGGKSPLLQGSSPTMPPPGWESYQQNGLMGSDIGRATGGLFNNKDGKTKIAKPCVFFNSPRGCKYGANCMYQHDASLPPHIERRGGKRIKLDRELVRRN